MALQCCQRRLQLPPIVCLFLLRRQRFRHISSISEENPASPHPPYFWVDLGRPIRKDDVPVFLLVSLDYGFKILPQGRFGALFPGLFP